MAEAKLVDLLLELHRTRHSCVVRFERGPIKKQLVVVHGNLSYAESNVPAEHLAHALVKLGSLRRQDLNRVCELMNTGIGSDEAAAAAAGLSAEQISAGICSHAVMVLASLLGWHGNEPRLFSTRTLPQRRFRLDFPMPQALVEAARIAAADRSLSPAGEGTIHAETDLAARSLLPLNASEAFAYALISKGPASTTTLCRLLPPGDIRPEELIRRLLLLCLVRVRSELAQSAEEQNEMLVFEQVQNLLRQFEVANLYDILAVPSDAGEEQIKAAYYEMARRYHPDRFAASRDAGLREQVDRLFTYITGAFATLGNPSERASYDEQRLKKESLVEAALQARTSVDADRDQMAEAMFRAGRAAYRSGDFMKAVERLRESVWLRTDVAKFQYWLALAQTEILSLQKEAERHFAKAIELDSMNPDFYIQLAKLYLKVHLPNRAEAQLQQALRWDPDNPEATRLLLECEVRD